MRLLGKLLVIGFGFRFPVQVEVCFDDRTGHDAVFAARDQKQRRARIVPEIDCGCTV